MKYRLIKTPEYEEWLCDETLKSRVQIADRLEKIETDGHFGVHKELGDDIAELKWGNGRRIYYAFVPEANVLILLGGNKNGQDKDIKKAKKLLHKYTE
jgi:putative addiction module killer protein